MTPNLPPVYRRGMRNSLALVIIVGVFTSLAQSQTALPSNGKKGKVLILENERVLEGDVERVGNQYLIRRSIGETWVPAERVLTMCQSKIEAYQFLRTRTNLEDADEHLKLANWCHLNGLIAEARAEVAQAAKLRPNHRPTQRLLTHLQQTRLTQDNSPLGGQAPPPEATTLPSVDLTEEALGQFATRVQPILMNTCAGCHANGKGGTFKLVRTYDATLNNRKAVQQNLAAVLAQVNVSQPQASPLLTKAVSVHGDLTQSPLRNRQALAFRSLDEWVRRTIGNNPQLRETSAAALPVSTPMAALPTAPMAPAKTVPTPPGKSDLAVDREPTPMPGVEKPVASPVPEEKAVDPFDPGEFNKQSVPAKPATPVKP